MEDAVNFQLEPLDLLPGAADPSASFGLNLPDEFLDVAHDLIFVHDFPSLGVDWRENNLCACSMPTASLVRCQQIVCALAYTSASWPGQALAKS